MNSELELVGFFIFPERFIYDKYMSILGTNGGH
jgi:hypothetical protein